MNSARLSLLAFCCLVLNAATASPAIPLSFEQRDPALFVAHTGGDSVQFRSSRIFVDGVTLHFLNGNAAARLEGVGQPSPVTYIGAGGNRSFQQFSQLAMRSLYPGIDAIFYGNSGRLEYDLKLNAGASASSVLMTFENARELSIQADSSLTIVGPSGTLRQLAPRVFQGRRQISAHYVLTAENQVGIRLGKYNPRRPLTIDPVLVYTKYLGGSNSDSAAAVATDAQGNIYVAGHSNSLDFPLADKTSQGPIPPLIALSGSGQTVTRLLIPGVNSVDAVGGTPDGRILYAGAAGAIYLSTDSGLTWNPTTHLPVPILASLQPAAVIYDIAVDSVDPSRAYVATSRGLFATADHGLTWVYRNAELGGTSTIPASVATVAVSAVNHALLYASVIGQPGSFYKSTDAGTTWQVLYPAYAGEPAPSPYATSQIAFTMAPGGNDIYVIDTYSILFRSSDQGATWQARKDTLFGAKSIRVDPADPAIIYVLDAVGLQKSTDAGLTFSNVDPAGIQGNTITAFAYDGDSRTLYLAAFQSIYVSTDGGLTWQAAPIEVVNVHVLQVLNGRVFAGLDTPQTSFLVKLDPTGSHLLYSTFFSGQPMDNILALKVDDQGKAYMAGSSFSPIPASAINLSPPTPRTFSSAFIAKIVADGTRLEWLSMIGGSRGAFAQALALDSAGSIYITGQTSSPDFPTTPNALQPHTPTVPCTRPRDPHFLSTLDSGSYAFATKVSSAGTALIYSTFLTGACGSSGQAIAVNGAGEAFVGGYTTSPDMPVSPAAYQPSFPGPLDQTSFPNAVTVGFVTRLSADGTKALSGTYIGGGYSTLVNAIALDASGNPVATGATWGIAPGATPGAYQTSVIYQCGEPLGFGIPVPPSNGVDAYALKLDPALSKAFFLTYLGGSCFDSGTSLAIGGNGNLWITGNSSSTDFPLNSPFQLGLGGFVSELSSDGSKLLFSSFSDGTALAIDPKGFVYLAGQTRLPVVPKGPMFQGSGTTATLARLDPAAATAVTLNAIVNATGPPTLANGVAPGQLIRIQGRNLGPPAEVDAKLDATGSLPFALSNTRVLFDDIPAPLFSVQDGVIECVVPFEVSQASQSTQVTVEASGQRSNSVRISVFAIVPQILAVVNEDGTLNSASNPAAPGSAIVLYVTGLGQTNPPGMDGRINASAAAKPLVTVYAVVGSNALEPEFVGSAIGLVAGITQVNVRIPLSNNSSSTFVSVNTAAAPLYVK